jgi:hypothetical protein
MKSPTPELADKLVVVLGDTTKVRELAAAAAWDSQESSAGMYYRQQFVPPSATYKALTDYAERAEALAKWWINQEVGIQGVLELAQWSEGGRHRNATAVGRMNMVTPANLQQTARWARELADQIGRPQRGRPPVTSDAAEIVRHLAKIWRKCKLGKISTSEQSRFVRTVGICFDTYPIDAPAKLHDFCRRVLGAPNIGPILLKGTEDR